jgi:hypothetical protein
MSRLIFVPQFPTKLRYQEFWYTELQKEFKKYYDEVIVLGGSFIYDNYDAPYDKSLFSPIQQAITLELRQIDEFNNMNFYEDDTLFLSDLSFPGLFSNILHHKKCKNMFCFVHGTSKNNLDYFEPVKNSKWLVEKGQAKLFKKIFLGSYYHKNKLNWKNTCVVGVPVPSYKTFNENKKYDIISVVRQNPQKISKKIEDKVERNFSKIIRKDVKNWDEYYRFLSSGKVLLITTKEETFGYSCMEAIMNNTIVIAPNNFSYPELLPQKYLYNDINDLDSKLWTALNGGFEKPSKLLCQDVCENFYKNIINEMKG